jgi:MFS family permease
VKKNQDIKKNLHAIEWLNFFLADVQTGLGPFVAAYLASTGWSPARVGYALTFAGLTTVAWQTPGGALIDAARRKRLILGAGIATLALGALLLLLRTSAATVYAAQFLIGTAGPFLAPTLAAITLGIVGAAAFDRQFGRNQAFNSAGNVFSALLIAYASYKFGYRSIFVVSILMAIPSAIALLAIDGKKIDYAQARGLMHDGHSPDPEGISALLRDRVMLFFLLAAFLFHMGNAAMLPQLGELLSKDNLRAAAPFMSACVIVTQFVIAIGAAWIGKHAAKGRKPLLLFGFGVLPLRGVLYTLVHNPAILIAIQLLDGVANAIFGVVSILVIRDMTEGTGRFNLASGTLATMVGIGAAVSTAIGGFLIQHLGYSASFLGLASIAFVAFLLLWILVPETLRNPK